MTIREKLDPPVTRW